MPFLKLRFRRSGSKTNQLSNVVSSSPRKWIELNIYYLIASAVVIILLVVGFAFASLKLGSSGDSNLADKTTGMPGIRYEIARYSQHVSEPTPIDYTDLGHYPPTSGHHWPKWAKCGFYEDALPDELVVHNMEHGNIVISYNLVKREDINALKKSFSDVSLSKLWGVARFYGEIPEGQISLSTWGVTDSFTNVDASRIRKFFEVYHGALGPENAPCNDHPK